jgi:hypothetical protein
MFAVTTQAGRWSLIETGVMEKTVWRRRQSGFTRTSARSGRLPDTLKLMLLQNTQECDLSLDWKLSDFVEEDRASICQFKPTQALLSRAGKGTLLMAEQLRSDQIAGNCRTVHTNECARGTR